MEQLADFSHSNAQTLQHPASGCWRRKPQRGATAQPRALLPPAQLRDRKDPSTFVQPYHAKGTGEVFATPAPFPPLPAHPSYRSATATTAGWKQPLKATQGGWTEAANALKSQELTLGGSAHPAGDVHQGKPPNGTVQPRDQEKPNPAGCRGYSRVAQLRSANPLRPALGWDTAVHANPRDPPRLRGRTKATAAPCWHGAPGDTTFCTLSHARSCSSHNCILI